jgi:hypothetical protein
MMEAVHHDLGNSKAKVFVTCNYDTLPGHFILPGNPGNGVVLRTLEKYHV